MVKDELEQKAAVITATAGNLCFAKGILWALENQHIEREVLKSDARSFCKKLLEDYPFLEEFSLVVESDYQI